MRRQWTEHGDETHQRTAEDDERAHVLARLAAGPVAWASLPKGLPEQLLTDGDAEQDGVIYLRARTTP